MANQCGPNDMSTSVEQPANVSAVFSDLAQLLHDGNLFLGNGAAGVPAFGSAALAESIFYRPPMTQSGSDKQWRKLLNLSPSDNRQGLAVEGYHYVSSSIPALLFFCCPTAVLGGIGAIIVDTFNAVCGGRAHSHVVQKVCKAMSPTFAHVDAASAVSLETVAFAVITALNDSAPDLIFRSAN